MGNQMDYLVGMGVILGVVVIVAIAFLPQLSPLYDDVIKIANEALELEEPKEKLEEDLRIKQFFVKFVEDLEKCSKSKNKDCSCLVDDSGFIDGYTLSLLNKEDSFGVELYDVSGDKSGVLLKNQEIKGNFGIAREIEDDKLICDKIRVRQSMNPLFSFLANTKKDEGFTRYYKSEEGDICLVFSSFEGVIGWHGFRDNSETKDWFSGKPGCI